VVPYPVVQSPAVAAEIQHHHQQGGPHHRGTTRRRRRSKPCGGAAQVRRAKAVAGLGPGVVRPRGRDSVECPVVLCAQRHQHLPAGPVRHRRSGRERVVRH
jgi:hypothetical protein